MPQCRRPASNPNGRPVSARPRLMGPGRPAAREGQAAPDRLSGPALPPPSQGRLRPWDLSGQIVRNRPPGRRERRSEQAFVGSFAAFFVHDGSPVSGPRRRPLSVGRARCSCPGGTRSNNTGDPGRQGRPGQAQASKDHLAIAAFGVLMFQRHARRSLPRLRLKLRIPIGTIRARRLARPSN
jgi:hypothetical protein